MEAMTMVLLKVNKASIQDIKARIEALGPIYIRDFIFFHRTHGTVISFHGEVGLVEDDAAAEKCAICGEKHDNDLLTDICQSCEARINEEGSP